MNTKDVITIPFYITRVACGDAVPFCDGIEYVQVPYEKVKGIESPLLVEVTGNSMEPYFFHKEILIVDLGRLPRQGDFVLVSFNGYLMVKRLHFKDGQFCFISTNFLYPPIFVKDYDNWKILGVCEKKVKSLSELNWETYKDAQRNE